MVFAGGGAFAAKGKSYLWMNGWIAGLDSLEGVQKPGDLVLGVLR